MDVRLCWLIIILLISVRPTIFDIFVSSKLLSLSLKFLKCIFLDRIVTRFVFFDNFLTNFDSLIAKGILLSEITSIVNVDLSTVGQLILSFYLFETNLLFELVAISMISISLFIQFFVDLRWRWMIYRLQELNLSWRIDELII